MGPRARLTRLLALYTRKKKWCLPDRPNLVMASLGAVERDKPGGIVPASVFFHGTNGISVNSRTRIRDQERALIATDLRRVLREKARHGERTCFRQMSPKRTARLRQVLETGTYSHRRDFCSRLRSVLLVTSSLGARKTRPVSHREVSLHVASACRGRFPHYRSALIMFFVLCATEVPLSLGKTAGGHTVSWVGFELSHRTHELGISCRRAECS